MFKFTRKRLVTKSLKESAVPAAPVFKTEYGYKITPMDMKCRDFQYKMGSNIYSEPDKVSLCRAGLHYCGSIEDLVRYGDIVHSRIFEVEASTLQDDEPEIERGHYYTRGIFIKANDSKKVAKSMTFTRELTEEEIYKEFECELANKIIFDYETFIEVRNLSALETENYIEEKIINTLISKGYSEALSNVIYKEICGKSGMHRKALYYKALKYADLEISSDMRVYMLFCKGE